MNKRNNFKKLNVPIFLSAFVTLTACTQAYVTDEALEYNRAISDFEKKQILLNAVRASKRHPMSYTAIASGNGTLNRRVAVNGSTSFARKGGLPAADLFLSSFGVSPQASVQNTNNFQTTNLNSQEFHRAIQTPITGKTLKFFHDSGWPKELLMVLAMAEINLAKGKYKAIEQSAKRECIKFERTGDTRTKLCRTWFEVQRDLAEECGGGNDRNFFNSGRNFCAFRNFQRLIKAVKILGLTFATTETKVQAKPGKVVEYAHSSRYNRKRNLNHYINSDSNEIVREVEIKYSSALTLNVAKMGIIDSDETRQRSERELEKTLGIVRLRSPEGIIYYLGELIAAQNLSNPSFQPMISYGFGHHEVEIFDVVKGTKIGTPGLVTVRDEENEYFSIVKPKYGDDSVEDRSYQTLALVKQLFNQNTSRKDLPASANISVQASN